MSEIVREEIGNVATQHLTAAGITTHFEYRVRLASLHLNKDIIAELEKSSHGDQRAGTPSLQHKAKALRGFSSI